TDKVARTAAAGAAGLTKAQKWKDSERKKGCRDESKNNKAPILSLQAREYVIAKTCLANWFCERCSANNPDSGGANSRHDDRQSQWQLDVTKQLPWPDTNNSRSLAKACVDAIKSGHCVAQDRKH